MTSLTFSPVQALLALLGAHGANASALHERPTSTEPPSFASRRRERRRANEGEYRGAKCIGGGIGCGQADLDIELEGQKFSVSIRPLAAK